MNTPQATAAAARLAQTRLQLQVALGVQPAEQSAETVLQAAADTSRDARPAAGRYEGHPAGGHQSQRDGPPTGRAAGRADTPRAAAGPPRPPTGPDTAGKTHTTPAAQLLLATLRTWWARHPLHTAGTLALQAANAAASPVAQKHPAALLLGAAAVGAGLAWAKPWRHVNLRLLGAALLPGLVPGLMPGLMSALSPPSSRAASSWWPELLRALLVNSAPRAQAPAERAPNPRTPGPTHEPSQPA